MNILYIIGNGFDIAQGMATSYPDFYNYLEKHKGNELLEQLKRNIQEDIQKETIEGKKEKLWSNMERAFGKYTSKISSSSDFIKLYNELSEQLQAYLKSEESKFISTSEHQKKFLNDFIYPWRYLDDLHKQQFVQYMERYRNESKNFYVMTLNYTHTLEKLLSLDSARPKEKTLGNGAYLRNIIHVHGELDDSIIIGVDNETQIENEAFRDDEAIKDWLVKIESNHAMGLVKHEDCEKWIKQAQLIIFYGVSFGETDLRWWEIIGTELKRRDNITIMRHLYERDEIPATAKQWKGQIMRDDKEFLIKTMELESEGNVEKLKSRIFLTVNSNIFKK